MSYKFKLFAPSGRGGRRGTTRSTISGLAALLALSALGQASAQSDGSDEELAKQLANPVAALISVPFQLNYDQNIGPLDEGERYTMNVQPVIPFELNDDWNLISRTILPVISQSDVAPGSGSQTGIGDIVQTLFFSPKEPVNGWIVGVGPAFLLPTGSNDLLTADQWAAGPSIVTLKQSGSWTYGALANHLWSFAGDSDRADVNATFVQPFVSYITPSAVTYTVLTESTYDWESRSWNVPVGAVVSKVFRVGEQNFSLAGGLRYTIESPDAGAEGLGFRLVLTALFPR